jgi:hypothetical protein
MDWCKKCEWITKRFSDDSWYIYIQSELFKRSRVWFGFGDTDRHSYANRFCSSFAKHDYRGQ